MTSLRQFLRSLRRKSPEQLEAEVSKRIDAHVLRLKLASELFHAVSASGTASAQELDAALFDFIRAGLMSIQDNGRIYALLNRPPKTKGAAALANRIIDWKCAASVVEALKLAEYDPDGTYSAFVRRYLQRA